ncbi:MAG: hypothetical protein IJ021_05785 [Clostridia bacterium]|nr:hypothetical protein [Clostridia bacterium]
MTENNELTKREIFEQIKILQKELTENTAAALAALNDTVASACEETEENNVSELCTAFMMHEENIEKMLKFYEKMYDDIA